MSGALYVLTVGDHHGPPEAPENRDYAPHPRLAHASEGSWPTSRSNEGSTEQDFLTLSETFNRGPSHARRKPSASCERSRRTVCGACGSIRVMQRCRWPSEPRHTCRSVVGCAPPPMRPLAPPWTPP